MNTRQIIEAMKAWRALEASRDRPCIDSQKAEWFDHLAEYLAEHLAAVLPVTVDELVATLGVYVEHANLPYDFASIKILRDGGGNVLNHQGVKLFGWDPSDNPGKTAVEAIKAHTKSEPTEKEEALEAAKRIGVEHGGSRQFNEDMAAIRKALEAKGCES